MDPKGFLEKIKTTKKLLESENGGQLYGSCMVFIKDSIDFLKDANAAAAQSKVAFKASDEVMLAWYPVLLTSLHTLHKCRGEEGFKVETVLSYMNHLLIHLVSLKDVPIDWFRCLGLINLEFLHYYSLCPSNKPDYLSSLAQKSYQCMRVAARDKSSGGNSNRTGGYFLLLVIGSCYLTMDTSVREQQQQQQQQQDVLAVCKGYIANFLQVCVKTGESFPSFVDEAAKDSAEKLFDLCCTLYCLRGGCTTKTAGCSQQMEKDVCFFKELFRLVLPLPQLRGKLVNSNGDFSSLIADICPLDGFRLEAMQGVMMNNATRLQESIAQNTAFQFAISVCRVVHILLQRSENLSAKEFEHQLKTAIETSTDHLHSIFADHPSPGSRLPPYVGELVSILSECAATNSSDAKTLTTVSISSLHELLSLSLDALIREVICYSGSSSSSELSSAVASLVSHRSYSMAVVNRWRMSLLQTLLVRSDVDNAIQVGVSGRLKCSLNLLCVLVKKVNKGTGLSPESSSYRLIFKTLKNAVSSLGGLCLLLRRSDKHEVVISVAGPLWPVANLPEMLSYVSHHESLCEAYRVQGDIQSACQVIVQASALASHLVTQSLLKSILKIAKTEASLKIPVLFARCPEETSVAILLSLVRMISASSFSSQLLTKHQKIILRHLSASSSTSTLEKVLVKLLLAEMCWYYPDACNNSEKPQDLLQECAEIDADPDADCRDFKAQAILLSAEIQHAMACLKANKTTLDNNGNPTTTSDKDSLHNNPPNTIKRKNRPASASTTNSSVTPEGNSNNRGSGSSSINMPPPTALDAPEIVSSVLDTPVTHSSKGKISKTAARVKGGGYSKMKTQDAPPAPNPSSFSSIFPIWEDSHGGSDAVDDKSSSSLDSENVEKLKKEDSDLDDVQLMKIAKESLRVWMEWYSSLEPPNTKWGPVPETKAISSSSDLEKKEGKGVISDKTTSAAEFDFRVDRSLSFLQHLVSLALAHDKPIFAVDCLNIAKELATKSKRPIVATHIRFTLLSLLGHLGLGQEAANNEGGSFHSSENEGLQTAVSVEDILSQGESGEPSHLVSLASYLYHTDQIHDSVRVQKSALASIESAREKEYLTPTLTLQLSQLKCLMVECSRMVEMKDVYHQQDMAGQHPLQSVCDALKYITSLKSYFTGKNEHVLTIRGASVDSWQMIYCYLKTLYLGGKVFLQAGMVKSATTYLQEGLKMADSCLLSTWSALFKTALANISINYSDSVTDASKYLQDVSQLMSAVSLSSTEEEVDLSSVDSILRTLSALVENFDTDSSPPSSSSCRMDRGIECNPSVTSPVVDFSPKFSVYQAYRIWLEAEVALQTDPPDFPKAISLLTNAKQFTTSLLNTTHHYSDAPNSKQLPVGDCELLIVETMLRLGQAFLFLLADRLKQCQQSHDSLSLLAGPCPNTTVWNEEDILEFKRSLVELLEKVIQRGKRLSYCYEGKVLTAKAQLLKIHASFFSTRLMNRKLSNSCESDVIANDKGKGFLWEEEEMGGDDKKNDKDDWMDCHDDDDNDNNNEEDEDYEASCIAKEVKYLKLEEEFWNEKQKQRIRNEITLQDVLTPSPTLSNTACRRSLCSSKSSLVVNENMHVSTRHLQNGKGIRDKSPSRLLSPSSSATKRSSSSIEDEENVVPSTPPKMVKDGATATLQNPSCFNIEGMSTPKAFLFHSATMKSKRGGRGGGGRRPETGKSVVPATSIRARTKETDPVVIESTSEASKNLCFEFNADDDNDNDNNNLEDENVLSLSNNVRKPIRRGAKAKTTGRGRRGENGVAINGKGNVGSSDVEVGISNVDSSPASSMDCDEEKKKDLRQLEQLSPLTDQLSKLNIDRRNSVSPVKRKSGGRTSDSESTTECKEEEEIVVENTNVGRGRGGRGRVKTNVTKSSVASRKKTKVATNEEEKEVNSFVEEVDENALIEQCEKSDESPTSSVLQGNPKDKRKGRITTAATSKKTSAKTRSHADAGRSTRRTRRYQSEEEEQADECPVEIQRGSNGFNDETFSSTNFDLSSSSLLHGFPTDNDDSVVSDVSFTQSNSNFQDFESPIRKKESLSSTSSIMSPVTNYVNNVDTNFDVFSSPLRELHLNSPIEIPRGKPQRKTVLEKNQKSSGRSSRQKIEAAVIDSHETSPTEKSRGLGDDDGDLENDAKNRIFSARRPGKSVRNTKSTPNKLSLKKNTKRATAVTVLCERNDLTAEENYNVESENDCNNIDERLPEGEIALKSEVEKVGDDFLTDLKMKKTTTTTARKPEVKRKVCGGKRRGSAGKSSVQNAESVKKGVANRRKRSETSSKVTECSKASPATINTSDGTEQIPVFFSTTDSVIDNELLEEAEESLRQLSAFPPSHVFNHLSKATALLLMKKPDAHSKDTQSSIAAHLSNSMHVTFQHMLNKNLISKLRVKKPNDKQARKEDEEEEEEEEMQKERVVMREVLDDSFLSLPVEASLTDRLKNIPSDWVVVQMAVVSLDLLHQDTSTPCQVMITRMSSRRPPMTFPIPLDRWKEFIRAKRVLEKAIVHNVEGMTPEKYWTYRFKNDQDMKNLLYFLQEKFLCGLKWLLSGRLTKLTVDKKIAGVLHQRAFDLMRLLQQQQQGVDYDDDEEMDVNGFQTILEILLVANDKDVDSFLLSMWPSKKHVRRLVKLEVFKLQRELWPLLNHSNGQQEDKEVEETKVLDRGPVVLILDKQFNAIPWESMPILQSDNISRVPSLAALDALLRLHQHRTDSVFLRGVGRRKVMTVIDPETNLENSVKLLRPQYEKYEGWKCQTQQTLTVSALKDYLNQELYIYSGHGWGRQFVAGDELQMFRAKAVSIIMGCNSGRFEYSRMKDGQGPPLYFLLAGCPAVVGNLWVVTDKDIDKLTSRLCQAWMNSKGQRSLGHLLNQARQACKLVGLNGYAPVVYGLPIKMN